LHNNVINTLCAINFASFLTVNFLRNRYGAYDGYSPYGSDPYGGYGGDYGYGDDYGYGGGYPSGYGGGYQDSSAYYNYYNDYSAARDKYQYDAENQQRFVRAPWGGLWPAARNTFNLL
jgi:hypothetical protein